jgi:hypothetical protein
MYVACAESAVFAAFSATPAGIHTARHGTATAMTCAPTLSGPGTLTEFVAAMRRYRRWAGNPSFRLLAERCVHMCSAATFPGVLPPPGAAAPARRTGAAQSLRAPSPKTVARTRGQGPGHHTPERVRA